MVRTRLVKKLQWLCFRLMPTEFAQGDLVELRRSVRYRERVDADHLPSCPAGTRARVTAVGPMGYRTGVVLRLLDEQGEPTRYWTGAETRMVRRLASGS